MKQLLYLIFNCAGFLSLLLQKVSLWSSYGGFFIPMFLFLGLYMGGCYGYWVVFYIALLQFVCVILPLFLTTLSKSLKLGP